MAPAWKGGNDTGEESLEPDQGAIPDTKDKHENLWYNRDFSGYRVSESTLRKKRPLRLVCVGAGPAGITVAAKAGLFLQEVELQIYEKNSDVGGTWLVNRYPGCTCDIPSHSYQFTWARNPNWSSFYSSAEEIWQYLKDTTTKYDLEKYMKFNHTVKAARWDEVEGVWDLEIQIQDGSVFHDRCDVLADGSGILRQVQATKQSMLSLFLFRVLRKLVGDDDDDWKYPDISGIELFKGKLMHTARYDHSYDLSGKTVAVIGGGSSGVQVIPKIQGVVAKLIAFLRSPTWITTGFGAKFSGPGGTNFTYPKEQRARFVEDPEHFDEYCRSLEGELNKRFTLMHLKSKDQMASRKLVSEIMRHELGDDPTLVQNLVPEFGLGCRRMTPGPDYLKSLTQSNVEVVSESVARLTEDGVVDVSGVERKVDVVICATGFNTSFSPPFDVIGRNGRSLNEEFSKFPLSYLGIMAEGFPNYFMLVGPNGPASHGSYLPILDWHSRYMFQMVTKMQEENIHSFDPKKEVITELFDHTHELFKRLVWSSACRSWFKNGREHGPVTAVYAGSRLHYFEVMKTPRFEDYNIKYRSSNRFQFFGNGYTMTEQSIDGDPVWYFKDEFIKTAPPLRG